MTRFSLAWWLAVLPTSILVGGTTFFLLGEFVSWTLAERLIAAAILTIAADLAIAAWIEGMAPTRILFGPGEKAGLADAKPEVGVVTAGFEGKPNGRVRVRGESWPAIALNDDSSNLAIGVVVRVVDRVGLNLVVTTV